MRESPTEHGTAASKAKANAGATFRRGKHESMEQNGVTREESVPSKADSRQFPRWIKLSAIAAASALAGGLAAAWYYRKTLEDLRQAEELAPAPDFGILEEHVDLDT
jgi:hypothetical protein